MSPGAWMMLLAAVVALASLLVVVFALVRSIRNHHTPGRSVWREFGLGLALMLLFFGTWVAHAIAEWQTYTDEQQAHGESTSAGDFVSAFAQSTLENWQSEFLQLFAFVALSALFIHKGSAESKDTDEKIEASLRRIEERLGTLPPEVSRDDPHGWELPHTALDVEIPAPVTSGPRPPSS
ncbi:MAG TPA: DUF6766 family protein [Acidimicrobiales bacterium]|nr:DUF6766 family protein [Acidimicrobiales bacterium]